MWDTHTIKAYGKEIKLPFSIELDEEVIKSLSEQRELIFMYIIETLCKGFNERLNQQNNEGISW